MNSEGSVAIESSLVFPIVIFFTVMIISISIFAYENVSAKLKFNNEVQKKIETFDAVDEEDEIVIENKMLFKNTWEALTSKGTEISETIKKKIKSVSIINKINERDYELEKAGEILKGDATWMKTDQSHLI